MAGDKGGAPTIIKRKKVVAADGHHGGAWKVAYADFVTAMMAFFLLMWLLNATTEKQRKGIADYFSPTIAVSRVSGGGDGLLSGHSVFSENVLPRVGTGATSLNPTEQQAARGAVRDAGGDPEAEMPEDAALAAIESALLGGGGESLLDRNDMRHVELRMTDEGLILELFDLPDEPLFEGDQQPTPLLQGLLRAAAQAAAQVRNPVAIEAHVQSQPVIRLDKPVWDHSAGRAAVARDILTGAGLGDDRVVRTTAHADREPAHPNPMAPRNNRIEIVFLRQ